MILETGSNDRDWRLETGDWRRKALPASRFQLLASRHRGLTLIELLISVAILASAAVLIMQALARGAYTLALADNRLKAYAFCATKMADLEMQFNSAAALDTHGEFRSGRDQFEWHVESSAISDDPTLELITLTVGWQQGRDAYTSHVSALRHLAQAQP